MAHHVHFVGHPRLRATMVEPGMFLIEHRPDWQSSEWELFDEPWAVTLDEIEQRVMSGEYEFLEL